MNKTKMILTAIAAAVSLLLLTGCPEEKGDNGADNGAPSLLEGKLLILQAYGNGPLSGTSPAGVSHSFIELYNTTGEDISLDGIALYYAEGTDIDNLTPDQDDRQDQQGNIIKDGSWTRISLDGKTIPAGASFLVLGARHPNTNSSRHIISDDYGDINDNNLVLSRRAFKAVLLESNINLNNPGIQNPFNIDGNGKKIAGYIDMIGTANTYQSRDLIFGFENEPARNSASEAARRKDLNDTDDNSADFIAARYATGGMSNEELEVRRPRNSGAGSWNPFAEPASPPPPPPGTAKLMILQANTFGNNNNIATGSGFPRSLVELYNNTNDAVNLTSGNYYLHIGTSAAWTHSIKLEGTIPARSSFLIATNNTEEVNDTPRASLPAPDQEADFIIPNGNFQAAVVRNHAALEDGVSPFNNSGITAADYIDMLGVGTGFAEGTAFPSGSHGRPRVPRRISSLNDTDDNSVDFGVVDYRSSNNGFPADDLYKVWPRNSTMGAWDPIAGTPPVHPVIP